MSDSFTELLVQQQTPIAYKAGKVALIALAAICGFIGLTLNFFFLIPAVVFAAGAYFVSGVCDLEFEYLYLNGEFDVDKIIAKQRRKKVINIQMDKVEIVAPTDSHHLDSFKNQKYKSMDFSSKDPKKKTYTMIYNGEKEKCRIIFEPNEIILKGMRTTSPRKIIM